MRYPARLMLPFVALAALALGGCVTSHEQADRASNSLGKAGENLRDAVDPPKGPAEQAGRTLDRTFGD